jgi:hypothetical protein
MMDRLTSLEAQVRVYRALWRLSGCCYYVISPYPSQVARLAALCTRTNQELERVTAEKSLLEVEAKRRKATADRREPTPPQSAGSLQYDLTTVSESENPSMPTGRVRTPTSDLDVDSIKKKLQELVAVTSSRRGPTSATVISQALHGTP